MSSPTNQVLPLFEIQQKTVRGKHPPRPQDAPGMCHPAPLRAPPARPTSLPPGRGRSRSRNRSKADAHRGLGLVTPTACSRLPAGPRPRQPALLTASRSAPAADHPGPALFTSRFSRSHSQMLPRGRPAAGPGRTGFQAARTGPFCWRSRRPGGA